MKKIIIALFCIFLVGCGSEKHLENENNHSSNSQSGYEFTADKELSKFISDDLLEKVTEGKMGAVPPEICHLNEKYIAVLNYNGLLIYDIAAGKFETAIDILGLGYKQIQGSEPLEIRGNEDYMLLSVLGMNSGYVYSFEKNALQKSDELNLIATKSPEFLYTKDEKIAGDLPAEAGEVQVVRNENLVAVLRLDYNEIGKSTISISDRENKKIKEFELKNRG